MSGRTNSADSILAQFEIGDLFRAYRKAKNEAFRDSTHFNSISFANYEQRLERNLMRLLRRLNDRAPTWMEDTQFIGRHSCLPKSIEAPSTDEARDIHYATLNPVRDWEDQCKIQKKVMQASFRQVILPTIDYLVVSALWVMKVGCKFDDKLSREFAYAHEIRRVGKSGPIAEDARNLFQPYIYGYRRWRSNGLNKMQDALDEGTPIVAVTMDVERFYHCVSPRFLCRPEFHKRLGVSLTDGEKAFNTAFVESLMVWYGATPDSKTRNEGALPVGLPASRVISNVLLAEFDRQIAKKTNAIYYGRYADDVFLVVKRPKGLKTGEDFVRWLRVRMDGWLSLHQSKNGSGLRLVLPYARDSRIVFANKKQKIFYLDGGHGKDLVEQIVEKIKQQSSEYRDLPQLPDNESQMAAQALLASADATLEADALRKAEAVSIRRLGFAMLLSDVEAYARDLSPAAWKGVRFRFYDLVQRYVLTPVGVFDYFVYIVRVFGLMVSCEDYRRAGEFLDHFESVSKVLLRTSTCGTSEKVAFREVKRHYYRGFAQVAIAATSPSNTRVALRRLVGRTLGRRSTPSLTEVRGRALALLKADLARRPYYDYWFNDNRVERSQPMIPKDFSVRRVLALTKRYRGKIKGGLNPPYWPAIAFATRPIPLWSLCISAPELMAERGGLEKLLWATRGSKVNPRFQDWSFVRLDESGRSAIEVPDIESPVRRIGLPSYLTTADQWKGAFNGSPDVSLSRYVGIRKLINRMLKEAPDLRYVVLPECSIRFDWALGIAQKLATRGVSLIAGIENRGSGSNYTNEALVSLSSNFFGRRGALCFMQRKLDLATHEAADCETSGKVFKRGCPDKDRPVYLHGGLCLGVLICSDLTTIANRAHFQGAVDALFVLEWNQDLTTFEFLVESAAHDLHAAVVQVNNREYGDSRIRVPFYDSFRRDVVQVKGGEDDFFVVTSVDFGDLRSFQRGSGTNNRYKPLPIGYEMSRTRKAGGW